MDGWTIAFIITTTVLTVITVRKMLKHDHVRERFALYRRLRRRGHAFDNLDGFCTAAKLRIRREAGQTDLDRWYRGK